MQKPVIVNGGLPRRWRSAPIGEITMPAMTSQAARPNWPNTNELPERERRVPPRPYRVARRGDRAAPAHRTRRRARVARCRRAGGSEDYLFQGGRAGAPSELFGKHPTLRGRTTSMYGPQRTRPCPMCKSLLIAWDGEVPTSRRASRSQSSRSRRSNVCSAFKKERGWRHLRLYSSAGNTSTAITSP